jgi:hypothetical protein
MITLVEQDGTGNIFDIRDHRRAVTPVLCGAGKKGEAIEAIRDTLLQLGQDPDEIREQMEVLAMPAAVDHGPAQMIVSLTDVATEAGSEQVIRAVYLPVGYRTLAETVEIAGAESKTSYPADVIRHTFDAILAEVPGRADEMINFPTLEPNVFILVQ